MKLRHVIQLGVLGLLLVGLAMMIPGTPVYLPDLIFAGARHDGRSMRSWMRDLKDPDVNVRKKAVHALGAIGPRAHAAVPALSEVLRTDDDRKIRVEAALALNKMDPKSAEMAEAVPTLGAALKDEDLGVRLYAAMALVLMEEKVVPAVPALIDALRDEANQTNLNFFGSTIQERVVVALGRSHSVEAVGPLTTALGTARTDPTRLLILHALGDIGEGARPALPQIRDFLKDNNEEVRKAAGEALRKIEGSAVAGS